MGHSSRLEAIDARSMQNPRVGRTFSLRGIAAIVVAILMCGGECSTYAFAQKDAEGTYPSGAALTIGVTHAQFPFYADNAAGFDLAFFYQRTAFLGVQLKGGSYPYSARFHQSPVTAGYRIGRRPFDRDLNVWTGWNPFAYLGGGVSFSQDSDAARMATSGTWAPVVQGSFGVDKQFQYFSWRVAEISWTQTYSPIRTFGTAGVSTGLVFNFQYVRPLR